MTESPTIEAAADALLRVLVKAERERMATRPSKPIQATPFVLRDPSTIPPRDALNLRGLATDPIGTACRAELRRIGQTIHTAGGPDALDEAAVEIAEMDPTHSGWRAMVLESAWTGIGGRVS